MRRRLPRAAAALVLFLAAAALRAEVQFLPFNSTGLTVEGMKGYLGEQDNWDRFVVQTDEPTIFLLFLWDRKELEPLLKIERKGSTVAELDLVKGNKVRLTGGGEFTCTISARSGSGHWLCVALSGREWDR